ncbi:MAG TPA: FAD-dependent oxidoreductase [Thermoplasmata archaeon]|nr:FAD-dependent oxidoreductase [Thermoplasmata archaeon]
MNEIYVDLAVIGGGPAGLASAISAKESGVEEVVVIDRNSWLGGILPQCIHDGFGVEEVGKSLTGPEYAEMYVKKAEEKGIKFMKETMVLSFNKKLQIIAVNKNGVYTINSKSIILATGCREKTRWHALIPGTRPSGIYTAGVAQSFINLYNIMPGKKVVILGSGDVGLIMARRFTLEGAKVAGVVEILPYASGLPRNVVQCLEDYGIPIFLSHTITLIEGKERIEAVTISKIDENMNVIKGSERRIECDTLLLSLGLIPENEIAKTAGIEIDNLTGGAVVNQDFETSIPNTFAVGNCLQVYDTVDILSIDAKIAGRYVGEKLIYGEKERFNCIRIVPGNGVRYVVPQKIDRTGKVVITLRVKKPGENLTLVVKAKNKEIFNKRMLWVNPANMVRIEVNISEEIFSYESIEVELR